MHCPRRLLRKIHKNRSGYSIAVYVVKGRCNVYFTLLVLLDLSSAFDTVNHQALLERLRSRFGVTGTALDWFAS